MPNPNPGGLKPGIIPLSIDIPPRYQDLDTLGHINNVALAGIFENARVHFNHSLGHHPADLGVRWLVAAVDLKFVAEAHFPHPLTVYSAVGSIGNSSWTIIQAAFQNGECVATCDTVIVMHGPRGKTTIGPELRAIMQNKMPLKD